MNDPFIERVEKSCTALLDLYNSFPREVLVQATLRNRTVKEQLAELAGWTWRCAAIVKAARQTDTPLLASPDIDGLRREYYQNSQKLSWLGVEHDYRQAQQALLRVLHHLPAERRQARLIQQTVSQEVLNRNAHFSAELEQACHLNNRPLCTAEPEPSQFSPTMLRLSKLKTLTVHFIET
ncbi:MAG TPA: ClbS/DfsB family four-helix bundle protein [Anaerolineae bacterium]|nr:ClbS/DfsB family four-helix bundle protein [Anaerolineae bacterium]HMR64900.1 ClbS/DfsB family four-helix bundle protein [Anaerolineae bacterium]